MIFPYDFYFNNKAISTTKKKRTYTWLSTDRRLNADLRVKNYLYNIVKISYFYLITQVFGYNVRIS